jgi:hypothetical protein
MLGRGRDRLLAHCQYLGVIRFLRGHFDDRYRINSNKIIYQTRASYLTPALPTQNEPSDLRPKHAVRS